MNCSKNSIGKLFINLLELEGKYFQECNKGDFLNEVFKDTNIIIPKIEDIITSNNIISWKMLKTGDIAVYCVNDAYIYGVVLGELERQICYVSPENSIIELHEFDELLGNYKYLNGFKIFSVD